MPEASPETAPSNRHLLHGVGEVSRRPQRRGARRISPGAQALQKEVGRRKVFFQGSNGLFFLLALIRANDAALHAEIQTHLDAVEHEGNPFATGFQAVLALLHLLRGTEPRARTLLDAPSTDRRPRTGVGGLRRAWRSSSSIPRWPRPRSRTPRRGSLRSRRTLPLVARVHAEILAKICRPARALRGLFARLRRTAGR